MLYIDQLKAQIKEERDAVKKGNSLIDQYSAELASKADPAVVLAPDELKKRIEYLEYAKLRSIGRLRELEKKLNILQG